MGNGGTILVREWVFTEARNGKKERLHSDQRITVYERARGFKEAYFFDV
jgi:hypothetical protein